MRWTRHIGASETSPVVIGNRLYVGDWLGNVYALDKRTGRTVWTAHTGGAVKGGIAVSGNRVYAGSYDGHLYAFERATGRRLWRASGDPRLLGRGRSTRRPRPPTAASTSARPTARSTRSARRAASASGRTARAASSTARPRSGSSSSSPARTATRSTRSTRRPATRAGRFKANGPISGSATVINGVVYFATLEEDGRTRSTARTGRLLWSFADGRYTPVVADKEHLYLVGYARLYAFAPR